jgi:citrate synthase
MADEKWKTAVSYVEPNKILLRGYPIDQLMGNVSFSQAIYLAIKGELPSKNVGKLLDAIFVSSIDHGVTPPSALTSIFTASTGADLSSAIAAGILSISKFHGGAIESAMETFYNIEKSRTGSSRSVDEAAVKFVKESQEQKKIIPGFGHRLHTEDPRTKKVFALAKELGTAGVYTEIAQSIERQLPVITNKKLPINVDGAIAAILCDLGIPSNYGNFFFIISRTAGLAAHIFEERERYKPMRRIDPFALEYDGPAEREIK